VTVFLMMAAHQMKTDESYQAVLAVALFMMFITTILFAVGLFRKAPADMVGAAITLEEPLVADKEIYAAPAQESLA